MFSLTEGGFESKKLVTLEEPSHGLALVACPALSLDRVGPKGTPRPGRTRGCSRPRSSVGGESPPRSRGARWGRGGESVCGALARERATRCPHGLPDWLTSASGTEAGLGGARLPVARRACRTYQVQWRPRCFTRGCPETRPLRPLRSRRWGHREPGETPDRCLRAARTEAQGRGQGRGA